MMKTMVMMVRMVMMVIMMMAFSKKIKCTQAKCTSKAIVTLCSCWPSPRTRNTYAGKRTN
jgi:hypothetical protein